MRENVCTRCHTVARPKRYTPGSIFIEIFLWGSGLTFGFMFMFIPGLFFGALPGLIYSIWRISAKKKICGSCGSPDIVPTNSKRGQTLINTAPERKPSATKNLSPTNIKKTNTIKPKRNTVINTEISSSLIWQYVLGFICLAISISFLVTSVPDIPASKIIGWFMVAVSSSYIIMILVGITKD